MFTITKSGYRVCHILSTAILIPLAFGVSGCKTLTTANEIVSVANTSVDAQANTLIDEKAYFALLQLDTSANKLASSAVDLGLIKPGSPTAIKIADNLNKLDRITDAGKEAKRLNDAVTFNQKLAEAKSLYAEFTALLQTK